MENTGHTALLFEQIDPPVGLCESILARVAFARRRSARVQLVLQTAVCFISGAALVPLAYSVGQEFYTSGFYDFASLFFSGDAGIISGTSHELLYSLLESLPAFAVLGTVAATVGLLWSLRRMIQNSKVAFTSINALA